MALQRSGHVGDARSSRNMEQRFSHPQHIMVCAHPHVKRNVAQQGVIWTVKSPVMRHSVTDRGCTPRPSPCTFLYACRHNVVMVHRLLSGLAEGRFDEGSQDFAWSSQVWKHICVLPYAKRFRICRASRKEHCCRCFLSSYPYAHSLPSTA